MRMHKSVASESGPRNPLKVQAGPGSESKSQRRRTGVLGRHEPAEANELVSDCS